MAWREIGAGNQADASLFKYHPIVYPLRPVPRTYEYVMNALQNILAPINEQFSPEHKMKMQQLAEYSSPQAVQNRQRAQALQGRQLDIAEQRLPTQEELKAQTDLEHSKTRALTEAYNSPLGQPDQQGRIFDKVKGQFYTPNQAALNASKWQAFREGVANSKGQPSQGAQVPAIPIPLQNANEIQPTPGIIPGQLKTAGAQEDQATQTPVGINPPNLSIAPDIMTDPNQDQWT